MIMGLIYFLSAVGILALGAGIWLVVQVNNERKGVKA